MKYPVLLLSIIFLSACVSLLNPFSIIQGQQTVRPSEGLKVSLDVSPHQVFAGSTATIYFDAQNMGIAPIKDVSLNIFDTGGLLKKEACVTEADSLLPDEIHALSCSVQAPAAVKKTQSETISARARFRSRLSAVQTIDIMSEETYTRQLLAGNIKTRPRTYTYRDKNMEITAEFSEEPPIVVRPGRQYFVHFTIKNIGNGLIDSITFGKNFLVVEQSDLRFSQFKQALTSNIAKGVEDFFQLFAQQSQGGELSCTDVLCCRNFGTIYPSGKVFPRITCELRLPGVEQLVDYQFLVPLVYDYEVRASTQLTVVR